MVLMAKDPAFLFYPGDYLRDTQLLSAEAQVAYDRIMCEHMRNICIRQQQLNFLTKRLEPDEKDALMELLTKADGGWQIEWVAESIEKRRAYSKSRRDNRMGKKKEDVNNICSSHDLHMENEIEDEVDLEKNIVSLFREFCGSKKMMGVSPNPTQRKILKDALKQQSVEDWKPYCKERLKRVDRGEKVAEMKWFFEQNWVDYKGIWDD